MDGNQVDAILQRKKVLGEPLTERDKKILQQALYGLPPSGQRYKEIYNALVGDGPAESSYRGPDAGPTFHGPPTLDFLNLDYRQMRDLPESSLARGADAGGPYDENVYNQMLAENIQRRNNRNGIDHEAWAESAAESVARSMGQPSLGSVGTSAGMQTNGADSIPGEKFPVGAMMPTPQGYSFDDVALIERQGLRDDPRVMANMLAEGKGTGTGYESTILPFIQSADSLSAQGVLGRGTGSDLFGGPISASGNLANVEDVINMISQPQYFEMDPASLYRASFERSQSTDFEGITGQNGQPLSRDDIIDVTNSALMASAPFMTPEYAAALSGRLQRAAVQYKSLVARGEFNGSYPAYLESIGAGEWVRS